MGSRGVSSSSSSRLRARDRRSEVPLRSLRLQSAPLPSSSSAGSRRFRSSFQPFCGRSARQSRVQDGLAEVRVPVPTFHLEVGAPRDSRRVGRLLGGRGLGLRAGPEEWSKPAFRGLGSGVVLLAVWLPLHLQPSSSYIDLRVVSLLRASVFYPAPGLVFLTSSSRCPRVSTET